MAVLADKIDEKRLMRRGLSPVIATVLLIVIAIIIALIIIFWARSFIGESIEKSAGGKSERIESFCQDVSFSADVYTNSNPNKVTIDITNKGYVPLFGVQLQKISKLGGSKKDAGTWYIEGAALRSGESKTSDVETNVQFSSGDLVQIIPLLLGEINQQKKFYACDDKYGAEESVKSI